MTSDATLLLRALKLNAWFSGLSALGMFVAGSWLAAQFALERATLIYAIGAGLAVFAFQLATIVRTKDVRSREVTGIIAGDIAWVVASAVLLGLFYRTITPAAVVLVDLVAVVVLAFAVMQIRGLKQYRRLEAQRHG